MKRSPWSKPDDPYARNTEDPLDRVPAPDPDTDEALTVVNATIALNRAINALPAHITVDIKVIEHQRMGKTPRPVIDLLLGQKEGR